MTLATAAIRTTGTRGLRLVAATLGPTTPVCPGTITTTNISVVVIDTARPRRVVIDAIVNLEVIRSRGATIDAERLAIADNTNVDGLIVRDPTSVFNHSLRNIK